MHENTCWLYNSVRISFIRSSSDVDVFPRLIDSWILLVIFEMYWN